MATERAAHLDLPPAHEAGGVVRLPGSKSISLRALMLAALSEGATTLEGMLDSDDTQVMFGALAALGIRCRRGEGDDAGETVVVAGGGGRFPVNNAEIFVGNSGVSTRSLVAALAVAGGDYRIDGVPRMRERPIGDLVDALIAIGARIAYENREGFLPLRIGAGTLDLGLPISIRGEVSSQFVTGLLQALPLAANAGAESGVENSCVEGGGKAAIVRIDGDLISKPYVDMTIALMRRFGVAVERDGWREFRIASGARYRSPGTFRIEGDASGASYFLAAGAIAGSLAHGSRNASESSARVRVEGVGRDSVQGDVRFADALEQMGAIVASDQQWIEAGAPAALRGIEIDCVAIPDAAMTLAVVALFADGPTTLRGIGSWRVKETDRIAAMATELAKVGASVAAGPDWLRIEPPTRLQPATIDTYDDHRMAMCFSLVSLGGVAIRINDPGCVRKTYPEYFDDFQRIVR